MSNPKPLAITMGDPAGIGPEIVLKALAANTTEHCIVMGNLEHLTQTARSLQLNVALIGHQDWSSYEQAPHRNTAIHVLDCAPSATQTEIATISAAAGQASYDAIKAGVKLIQAGYCRALVTAPIHKEALAAAGVPYPGHTEMLADLCGGVRVAMMLATPDLRVMLATLHCSMRQAIAQLTPAVVLETVQLAHQALRQMGIAQPRIAVAGLNPHAGEGGLFGSEEVEIIAPAIAQAQAQGIAASGPWPGDTVFMRARHSRDFDLVVAMYHDQGLIPIKYLGLEDGVNVTVGLPFLRVSVDHGTAFDIAGRGIANPASLETALRWAQTYAKEAV